MGEPVTYGSVVQLKHRVSLKYLTQFKNRSEVDKLAMEASLIEYGSEGSWWQVLPAEKLRRIGEQVRYSDKLILENVKYSNSYLFVHTAKAIGQSEQQPPSTTARFEVNSSSSMSMFQVSHFATHSEMLVLQDESRNDMSRYLPLVLASAFGKRTDLAYHAARRARDAGLTSRIVPGSQTRVGCGERD
eukprot:2991881-Rhodomonas_salina.2